MSRRSLLTAVVALAMVPIFATAAAAVLTGFTGTSNTALRAATETDAWTTNSTVWVDLPNAAVIVPVTTDSGTILARFSGESQCVNTNAVGTNYCRARIVLETASGAIVEFHPQAGYDYLFDNTVDGRAPEAHALERALKVPHGQYRVKVQLSTSNVGTAHTMDDWTLAAEVFAP